MGAMSGVLSSYGGGSGPSPPPIPPVDGAVGIWALFNLNPVVDFAANVSGSDSTQDYAFVGVPSYPFDYAGLTAPPNDPPYLVNTWFDQLSQANNLSATGSARPQLQITSSAVVTGAGTSAANGTLSYFGQLNGRAAYVYDGSTDPTVDGILWADAQWKINTSGAGVYFSNDDVAFPWLVSTWEQNDGDLPVPVVTQGQASGVIQGSATTGLAGGSALYSGGSATGTITWSGYIDDFAGNSVLFETGTFADRANTINQLSLRILAGVLTFSGYDTTAIVALPNSKVKTLSVAGWYDIICTFDTGQVGTAQTAMKVNDSASGITSVGAGNLAGLLMGSGVPNVGARDAAGTLSLGFPGRELAAVAYTGVKSASDQTVIYNYNQYLLAYNGFI